jgi:pimeloyl-ACP methyl ester carboxylesterase
MGGFVGMRMAARRPDLLRPLLLLETSADPEPEENVGRYRLLTMATRVPGPRAAAQRARFVEVLSARRDIWRAVNGVIDRAGVRGELERIHAPTLILVGDEDVATTPAKARRIHEKIAGSRLVEVRGAGHSSSVEQPGAVTGAIKEFLGALR